jgi:ubiquinone/menaquinone biosynthesis C-methylase UbiE
MSTIVLMKAFESVPGKYDLGMRLITFGKIDQLHQEIANSILPDSKVLDIGCGTGSLLPMLAEKGARVTAIDKSSDMVRVATERLSKGTLSKSVRISPNTVMEIDRLFEDAEFDAVVLSLVMSELTTDEQTWVLAQSNRILKPAGVLLVADEFWPQSFLKKIVSATIRLPLHLIAYLYTQIRGLYTPNRWWKVYYTIVELPLMLIAFLVSEPLTRPLRSLERILPATLDVVGATQFWGGSIQLVKIKKASS